MNTDASCPCCSGKNFSECCKDIIEGIKFAQSPLELMRSRFSAHACKNMPHIVRTMRGKPLKLFDEEKTRDEWFDQSIWTKLEIIEAPEVAKHEKQGIVEFKAYYTFQDQEQMLHERSKFLLTNNQWYYISGQNKNAVINSSEKIGRNAECACGSGKKFKKCCGGV